MVTSLSASGVNVTEVATYSGQENFFFNVHKRAAVRKDPRNETVCAKFGKHDKRKYMLYIKYI